MASYIATYTPPLLEVDSIRTSFHKNSRNLHSSTQITHFCPRSLRDKEDASSYVLHTFFTSKLDLRSSLAHILQRDNLIVSRVRTALLLFYFNYILMNSWNRTNDFLIISETLYHAELYSSELEEPCSEDAAVLVTLLPFEQFRSNAPMLSIVNLLALTTYYWPTISESLDQQSRVIASHIGHSVINYEHSKIDGLREFNYTIIIPIAG